MEHLFPLDVIARARLLLDQIPGGVGAYRCDLASATGIYQGSTLSACCPNLPCTPMQ